MKVAVTRMTLNIFIWLFLGGVITSLIYLVEQVYYEYAPITNFIDFKKLDLADYTKGDIFQMVYAYRNSRIDTIGDFTFKIICGGVGQSDWNSVSKNVLLQKTDGLEIITIQSPILNDLPIGNCEVFTHIDIEIHDRVTRSVTLYDDFNVLK